jgi:hypothetical protein
MGKYLDLRPKAICRYDQYDRTRLSFVARAGRRTMMSNICFAVAL